MLTDAQITQFRTDGCIFPVRVMSARAALACRDKLEAFERANGGPLRGELRHKSHLLRPTGPTAPWPPYQARTQRTR